MGAALSLLLALGCDGGDGDDAGLTPDAAAATDSGSAGTDAGPDHDGGGMTDAGTAPGVDGGGGSDGGGGGGSDGGPPASEWTLHTHPCPGINRTDALLVEGQEIWIGCGSGTVGRGLYFSDDGGATWAIPATTPSGLLENFRVLSLHRGYNGLVYVAGEGPGRSMAISLDTSSSPHMAAAVLTRGSRTGESFLASPFVTTPSGAAFADSFVGHDALYRPNPTVGDAAAMWVNARVWEDDGGTSHQILDMVSMGENFVGCGSTIAEPPFVFLPSRASGAAPWRMTPVQLVSGLGDYSGEMWGVAASAARVVVVGLDQGRNEGKIFVSGADRYSAADYAQTDISPLLPTRVSGADSTWARGVCMNADRVVVVGEVQPLGVGDNTGFVLSSTDGGATFTDITPDGSPDTWSKCHLADDGDLVVAGAGTVGSLPAP